MACCSQTPQRRVVPTASQRNGSAMSLVLRSSSPSAGGVDYDGMAKWWDAKAEIEERRGF